MYLTLKVQMQPTDANVKDLLVYSRLFKQEIFKICAVFKKQKSVFEYRFKNISNDISWDSKCMVLSKAKEMYNENIKGRLVNLEFSSIWNAKSFCINSECRSFELILGFNQNQRILSIPIYWSKYVEDRLKLSKIISMVICQKNKKWVAYILLNISETNNYCCKELSVDVGIKVPAVTYTSDNKIKFFGNGREIRFYQRLYRSKYQTLQAQKKHKKMVEMHHKLHNILNDIDHKIARNIVNYAISEKIGVIKMEELKYINKSFDIKITSNIYMWSYRRLQDMIEYKAKLNGIKVLYVDPKNTSKKCPVCGYINKPRDRSYRCSKCGYYGHRDIVGAINILRAL